MSGMVRSGNLFAAVSHILLLHTALAPRRSDCFRPCRTPLIRVSCVWGFHAAAVFELLGPDARLEWENSWSVGRMLNGRKEYPPGQILSFKGCSLPLSEKARKHAFSTCCDRGSTRFDMYALLGEIMRETGADRRLVHCFKAILSEHDLDSVDGQSARAV